MSIIENIGSGQYADKRLNPEEIRKLEPSPYDPSDDEMDVRAMVIKHFNLGNLTMYTPRVELNDLSVVGRLQVDQLAFNTYQSNNGQPNEGDVINSWRSNAIRPVVRNKCISIAAHATARLIFPKIFAWNEQSEAQEDAAKVMRLLMEWAADQSNYTRTSMQMTLASLWSPAALGYTEYGEVFRNVKREKGEDGKWKVEKMLDEDLSGFKDTIVPVDELYIENIYEPDLQKQGWLIWRRVISYSTAQEKYSKYPNWQHVMPGMQVLYNDANQLFYPQYDSNMRPEEVEEILYWNKGLDVKLCIVNGILLSDFDNPNPRNDKLYPFYKMGYELLDEGRFFYYKSLAFKLQSDANIVNTLYPMMVDGTYLSIMPAMVNIGSETIGSEVIVPGAVTTLADPNSKFTPIVTSQNVKQGFDMLQTVEESLNESSQDPIQSGEAPQKASTAYEISRIEQNAATVLGLFIKMIGQFVKEYGRLRVCDILQYLTVADVDKISDNTELVYKTFLIPGEGRYGVKKVHFDASMPESMGDDEKLDASYKVMEEEGKTNSEIYKTNPSVFRNLKFMASISPDVLQPKSDELERAMKLELFDRAITLPFVDQEKAAKDFLFGAYKDIQDPDEYIKDPSTTPPQAPGAVPGQPPSPAASQNPLALTPSTGKV